MSDEIRLICENGHINTFIFKYSKGRKTPFCKICGSRTYGECPNCGKQLEIPEKSNWSEYIFLVKCEKCGKNFPWAKQAESKAKALMDSQALAKRNADKTIDSPEKIEEKPCEKQLEIQKTLSELEKTRTDYVKELNVIPFNSSDFKTNPKIIKIENKPIASRTPKSPPTVKTKYRKQNKNKSLFVVVFVVLIAIMIMSVYTGKSNPKEEDYSESVYVSRNDIIHRDPNCSGMIHYRSMSDNDAHEKGYRECKICY